MCSWLLAAKPPAVEAAAAVPLCTTLPMVSVAARTNPGTCGAPFCIASLAVCPKSRTSWPTSTTSFFKVPNSPCFWTLYLVTLISSWKYSGQDRTSQYSCTHASQASRVVAPWRSSSSSRPWLLLSSIRGEKPWWIRYSLHTYTDMHN